MAQLSRDRALLIACKALNPFVTFDLVKKVGNKVQPIPEAEAVGIKDLLVTLAVQDAKFGLHVIDSIMNAIFEGCRDEGFSVVLSKSRFVNGGFATIGALTDRMLNSSTPIDE